MHKIKSDIEIFDNILSKQEILNIHGEFIDGFFPWYMVSSAVLVDEEYKISTSNISKNVDTNTFEAFQFCHTFADSNDRTISNKSYITNSILEKLSNTVDLSEYNFVSRIKANFQSKFLSGPDCYNTPHHDIKNEHLVILYYVNNSDGDTFIFENDIHPLKVKQRISPKAGRFVIFNGNQFHAGIHPKLSDYRIVINFNLTKVNSSTKNEDTWEDWNIENDNY
jgi:hypothetical protein